MLLHHMNIYDKVHNVADSGEEINIEGFVDSVINLGGTIEVEDDGEHHDERIHSDQPCR
jgi:hypothetical protein